MRFWARLCDYSLLFLVLGAVTLFLPLFYDPLFYLFLALGTPLLWMPLEALCLSKWGTTPGKYLFGITVLEGEGIKLSFRKALKRAAFISERPGLLSQKILSFKRKCLAIVISLTTLCAGFYGNVLTEWGTGMKGGISAEGWVQFESEKEGFKISFPNDYQHESKQIIIPNTGKVLDYQEITSEESKKVQYSLNYMNIPRKWKLAGNATVLKYALDAIVKNTENTSLLSKEFTLHQGHRSLDFILQQGENQVKGRMVIVENTLYKLMIV
ncbi:MAG: RDD family protein, partial [Chlamydiota bacterium]